MNIIKLLTVIILLTSNLSFANDVNAGYDVNNTNAAPPVPLSRENDGLGSGGSTPIDDYAPLLVITAVAIAGLVSYRQRQLIKK